jgi:hypothetical protein
MPISPSDVQLITFGLKKELKCVNIQLQHISPPAHGMLTHLQGVRDEIHTLLQLIARNQINMGVVDIHRANAVTGLSIR